jgi:hypothetical protein
MAAGLSAQQRMIVKAHRVPIMEHVAGRLHDLTFSVPPILLVLLLSPALPAPPRDSSLRSFTMSETT